MFEQNQLLEELHFEGEEFTPKQKKIVAAAIEIFAEKGYAATSTSEIAKKAGVAEGTIFRHYKTKKELLLSIVAPMMAKMIAPFVIKDINRVLDKDHDTLEDFLKEMIKNRAAFMEKNMLLFRIVVQELPFQKELQAQFKEHIVAKVYKRMERIVEHYQQNGEVVEMPTKTVIRLFLSTIFGHLMARFFILSPDEWNDEEEMERTVQFLVRGLRPW
ncbi:TetR/AcrR family transcriptional regulator [Siminovitchia acidinfaciens]|uniref:TetR/AcrR family transcriptional regulator n=1 Tax=Siminovitchia acidinfaciens TaxID=2321395 RepID=A0A429XZY3_9BACI|nr:TetR/AcrR family transcriptional regulator [Siminovitchia acidinfaciens]RST74381.1 TetR/AcrR family transcriptional regulator [Siminovitchia acidinfaciens]